MRCPKCGRNNPDNYCDCMFCGFDFTAYKRRQSQNAAGYNAAQKTRQSADNAYGNNPYGQAAGNAGGYPGIAPSGGKKPDNDKKKMWIIIGSAAAAAVVIAVAVVLLVLMPWKDDSSSHASSGGSYSSGSSGSSGSSDLEFPDSLLSSNGDTVYIPEDEDLAYDVNEKLLYYDNLIIVYLNSDLSDDEAQALADTVGGTVEGDISGAVNVLQIVVESTDLDGIYEYANILMESDDVLYADYDCPVFLSEDADANPWSSSGTESDLGNEDDPDGNDWWAEAICAYTAWDLTDGLSLCSVNVGIIDNGFDLDHEDLDDEISLLSGYTANSESEHGTHVAGIIGADNNAVGIRGIAASANLICADWTPNTDDDTDSNYISYLSTGEYIEIIKCMIESDVRVINNSWSLQYLTEEEFINKKNYSWFDRLEDLFGVIDITSDYESWLTGLSLSAESRGRTCLLLIYQLLQGGYDDFIIVQSSGNDAVDSSLYNGFFCSVTESVYQKTILSPEFTYDEIKEHILIVGAVENFLNAAGYYKTASFSNYGETVDICAPGKDIYSTLLNDSYGKKDGTSMAAPMVTGAAALLWQIDDELTASEVRALLLDYCQIAIGTGDDSGTLYPMLNIGEAAYRAIYASYSGSVVYSDGTPAEGLTVIAVGENDITLATDVTSENGTYELSCSRFEIEYIVVIADDEETAREDIPDEYLSYDADAARDPLNPFYDPHDMGTTQLDFAPETDSDIPEDAAEYNGHHYYIYDVGDDPDAAQEYCESLGGHLATITSEGENDFLYEYITSCGYTSAYFGLSDTAEEGTWVWVTGEAVTYTNWADGEPNNEGNDEDYGMFYWKYSDGTWNDGDFGNGGTNSGGTAFICEWDE